VRVQETAWVQVTGASGRVLGSANCAVVRWWVFRQRPAACGGARGRADVVQVNVRGQALDLAPHIRSNVARFEVR
jgi:cytoskeleton protein RodZ